MTPSTFNAVSGCLERDPVEVQVVFPNGNLAGQLLHREVRRRAAEAELVERHRVVHRRVLEPGLHVEPFDPARERERSGGRAIVDRHARVDHLDDRQGDRAVRPLAVGFLPLPFDEPREVPAVLVAGEAHHGTIDLDLVEHDAGRHELEHAVVDRQRLDGDDPLARDVHRHVGEIDPEEQVAAETADRQLAVQVLLRLAHDVAPDPVPEPRRLRDDERQRHDADEQRADERHDSEKTADGSHDLVARTLN